MFIAPRNCPKFSFALLLEVIKFDACQVLCYEQATLEVEILLSAIVFIVIKCCMQCIINMPYDYDFFLDVMMIM